jgi:hypothetical protein
VAGPLQADETEQAMLDRIPLAGTRGTVAHGNDQAVDSGNGLVEAVFPYFQRRGLLLSRLCNWKEALVIVKPETLIGWHRKGLQLF